MDDGNAKANVFYDEDDENKEIMYETKQISIPSLQFPSKSLREAYLGDLSTSVDFPSNNPPPPNRSFREALCSDLQIEAEKCELEKLQLLEVTNERVSALETLLQDIYDSNSNDTPVVEEFGSFLRLLSRVKLCNPVLEVGVVGEKPNNHAVEAGEEPCNILRKVEVRLPNLSGERALVQSQDLQIEAEKCEPEKLQLLEVTKERVSALETLLQDIYDRRHPTLDDYAM
ncbi:hypothetical protein ACS0TY_005603 [Phlomoides rotata]